MFGSMTGVAPKATIMSYYVCNRLYITVINFPTAAKMVGEVGLEPTRLIQPADFKSAAYTNSATRP